MAILNVVESFALGVLVHMASICGCSGYLYVVSTESWSPPNVDVKMLCNLGSLSLNVTHVQLFGKALTTPLQYTLDEFEVITVDLNWTRAHKETDLHEAPLVINSTEPLTASVLLESQELVTSYLLIPVEAWGKSYLIVALQLRQSVIHLLGGETSTNVTLTLKFSSPERELDDVIFRHNIPSFYLWLVPFCEQKIGISHKEVLLLRGNNHFGVIINNCNWNLIKTTDISDTRRHSVSEDTSDTRRHSVGEDISDTRRHKTHHRNLANMFFPVELVGREYVVLGRHWITSSHVLLVATVEHTVVTVSGASGDDASLTVHLRTNTSSHIIQAHRAVMIINSTQPIYVYAVTAYHSVDAATAQLSDAGQEEMDLPCLSISLPVSLFFHTYVWRVPYWRYQMWNQHVIIIIPSTDRNTLRLNDRALNSSDWTGVTESQNWTVGMFPVARSAGARNLLCSDWMTPFGCYIKLTTTTVESGSRISSAGFNVLRSQLGRESKHRADRGRRYWTPKKVDLYRRNVLHLINCTHPCRPNSFAVMQAVCSLVPSSYNYPCDYIGKKEKEIINKTVPCPYKTICPEDCPVFKYGYNCTETCLNCEVDCEKTKGTCEECVLGYTYSNSTKRICDQACTKNTYGKMCKFKCHEKCGEDCAERVHGTCPPCKSLRWGFGCKQNCPLNCEGECTKDKGHCMGCKVGFMSDPGGQPLCELECPDGSYGANCNDICSPYCEGVCDKETGVCENCKKGYTHSPGKELCDMPCPAMTYGKNCRGSCKEKCGQECLDKVDGTCPACPNTKWGPGCAKSCPTNCQGSCDRLTGECEKCNKGFLKDSAHLFCEKECDSMHYGDKCEGSCELKCGRECADKIEGTCKPCEPKTWGFGCKSTCSKNCFKDECDNKTGDCRSCKPGFRNAPNDYTCKADCPPMTFGLNCTGNCKEQCQGRDCVDKVHGLCIHCPERMWGQNCTKTCGEHCKDDCDKGTGECTACNLGYTHTSLSEPFCQLACPPMTFGNNCDGDCLAKCGGECLDKFEGKCPGMKTSTKIVAGIIVFMCLLTLCLYVQKASDGKETKRRRRSDMTSSTTSTDYPKSSYTDGGNDSRDSRETFGTRSRYDSDIADNRSMKSKKSRASTVS